MTTKVFLNAAELVDKNGEFSCVAIHKRMSHGFSKAAERYRLMFNPNPESWYPPNYNHDACYWWWNSNDTPTIRSARVFALLLADAMNKTHDL